MSRLLALLCAAVCTGCVAVVLAPVSLAVVNPWFANSVGNATQVVSVVGTGGSTAKMDVYQRTAAGWQPLKTGITTHIGSAGMAPEAKSGYPATPMGVYSLDSAFGTAPNPGGGLPYTQVGPNHWWSGDDNSPTFNSMQVSEVPVPVQHGRQREPANPAVQAFGRDGRQQGQGPRQRLRVLLSHHRRRAHRGLCGDRRCHAGADHPLAAAWCGDRDRQVTPDLDCELCDGFSACCVVRFTFGVNRPARGPA